MCAKAACSLLQPYLCKFLSAYRKGYSCESYPGLCSEFGCVALAAKNNEAVETEGLGHPPFCIMQHPGFQAVFRWVLQMA